VPLKIFYVSQVTLRHHKQKDQTVNTVLSFGNITSTYLSESETFGRTRAFYVRTVYYTA